MVTFPSSPPPSPSPVPTPLAQQRQAEAKNISWVLFLRSDK